MDVQSDFKFLTRSTIKTDEKIKWEDGQEYPLVKVEVSSHPILFIQVRKYLLIQLVELRNLI